MWYSTGDGSGITDIVGQYISDLLTEVFVAAETFLNFFRGMAQIITIPFDFIPIVPPIISFAITFVIATSAIVFIIRSVLG